MATYNLIEVFTDAEYLFIISNCIPEIMFKENENGGYYTFTCREEQLSKLVPEFEKRGLNIIHCLTW